MVTYLGILQSELFAVSEDTTDSCVRFSGGFSKAAQGLSEKDQWISARHRPTTQINLQIVNSCPRCGGGGQGIEEKFLSFLQFCCGPKTVPKNKVYKEERRRKKSLPSMAVHTVNASIWEFKAVGFV